ncbi:MAG TPA: hypothetical protein VFI52_10290 [Gemmatimonadaceae bacterium]|nr:hypothetical protein [Gemmatimonadaceae bacterium]
MSHNIIKLVVPLLVSCAISLASCTASDQMAPQTIAPELVSVGPSVRRSGVEGLRLDLEWARSVARSTATPTALSIGAPNTSVPMDDLVTQLEAQLRLAEARAPESASRSASMLRGLAPAPNPSFDYLDPGDVGGATTIYSSAAPPATRNITVYAFTSCFTLPSMTIADLTSKITIRRFDTGEIRVQDWPFAADPRPNYTSATSPWIWSGPALSYSVMTKHICRLGPVGDWPYRDTQAFAVV